MRLRRKFHTLDVFTERPLAGNPLAVVLDCDGLDGAAMQGLAREFNLSETVFVLEPDDPVNTARLRIFTPSRELPFAGHPTIGAAILIAELRAPELLARSDVAVVLEEALGAVTCSVRHRQGQGPRANFVLPELPVAVERSLAIADVAAAVGLTPADIGFDRHVPTAFSAGVPFIFVPVASAEAMERAQVRPAFEAAIGPAAFLYSRAVAHRGSSFHARVFAPGYGIAEDPATGSAVAAFAGVLMQFEALGDGEHEFVIEQGFAIGRPSFVTLCLDVAQNALEFSHDRRRRRAGDAGNSRSLNAINRCAAPASSGRIAMLMLGGGEEGARLRILPGPAGVGGLGNFDLDLFEHRRIDHAGRIIAVDEFAVAVDLGGAGRALRQIVVGRGLICRAGGLQGCAGDRLR